MGNHNSRRRPGYRHSDDTRDHIHSTQLMNRLQDDALGEIDMTPTQIKCTEILLRKTLPDLSQIQAQVAARLVAVDRAAGRIDHG
jgi:hypothetical protein